MTPLELAGRARAGLRDVVDRRRLPRLRRKPAPSEPFEPGFSVTDVAVGAAHDPTNPLARRLATLLEQADQIVTGRLTFFSLRGARLGPRIDWNRDYASGRRAPLSFAPTIDYRDFREVGDAKFVWEPNRHHQLVILGRAYRATGDVRYAQAVIQLLTSWLDQCPFGLGMNWRSPLELAVRLINWVWALDLIRPAGLIAGSFRGRLLNTVHLHLWEIARKYSCGSSANNHRIGEAAGVFIAASYFGGLKDAPRWVAQARTILCREIVAQTHADGGSREQALGYQAFVVQFFTLAALVARRTGTELPPEYGQRLERMYEFGAAMLAGGTSPPMFGDCDDGYVLDLGRAGGDWRAWLSVAGVMFGRADFAAAAGQDGCECAHWLLDHIGSAPREQLLVSQGFPDSGYYLLQHGTAGEAERISVSFDCGELGFGPLAAHGHADALSFTLRAFGVDVLVDPGTYDYFTHPQWRQYFRSTRAHNTIEIDDQDQSVMTGPFMWGARARAKCLRWAPDAHGGEVAGEHDGYARLRDPVIHRRTLALDGRRRRLTIRDEISAAGRHDVAFHLHFAEPCVVTSAGANRFEVDAGAGRLVLELDARLRVQLQHGSTDPIAGWVSRGYHCKQPAVTLTGRCGIEGRTELSCSISIEAPRGERERAGGVAAARRTEAIVGVLS